MANDAKKNRGTGKGSGGYIGEANALLSPGPAAQIAWIRKNINKDKKIEHNPVIDGKVQNGFYEVIQYQQPQNGEEIPDDYVLISKGDNIDFNDLNGLFDYNMMPLNNRMVKK